MKKRTLAIGVGMSLALGISGIAVAANTASVPSSIKITQKAGLAMKPNRYIEDQLRWAKDVYTVKSGGTITVVNTQANEGPHTFTVVNKKDLPTTGAQIENCKICNKLGQAHGADPHSDAPPKFQYLENGVGQNTAPNVDRPGDSGVTGSGQKGEKITFKVTAKKGKTLYFMCIIHPWMQSKVVVG